LEQTPKPWHSTLPRKQPRQELQVVASPSALQVVVLVCWQVALQELLLAWSLHFSLSVFPFQSVLRLAVVQELASAQPQVVPQGLWEVAH
jgi:hypothetical protein